VLHFLIFGVEQAEFAVDVDSLDKVTELDSALLLEPTLTVPGGSRAYLRGVTHEALLLLDGDALLADERLFVDAP
jgi:chemotaxis signal transduction protein